MLYIPRLLHKVDIQPLTDMPCDVAMKRPHPRIHRVVLHDNVALLLQYLHIPSLRILRVHYRRAVPCAHAFGKDVHVVAVQMHRVDGAGGVVDDEADGVVGAGIVDVPFGGVGVAVVASLGEEEYGGVVVGAEGGIVDFPEYVAGFVDELADCEGYCCCWVWIGSDGVIRLCGGKGVL